MRLVLLLGALFAESTTIIAQDWAQWRGPQRDGAVKLAADLAWPKTLTEKWQVTVGQGHASPVVSDDRVYIFSRQEDNEVFQSYQELARYRVAETPSWAHPVIVGGDKVLVKDETTLTLWSLGG